MRHEHVKDVARLHRASLTGLLSALGFSAVSAFYTGCVRAGSSVGLVYVEDDEVRGFVFGSVHPEKVKQEALRRNPLGTLVGMLMGMSRRPSAAVWLLQSFRGANENAYDRSVPELTYLAVSGESRGGGIGKQLVEAFTNEMRNAAAKSYELSVDDDNQAAIAFYERLGFTATGRYREFGTMHLRYRLEIDSPAISRI